LSVDRLSRRPRRRWPALFLLTPQHVAQALARPLDVGGANHVVSRDRAPHYASLGQPHGERVGDTGVMRIVDQPIRAEATDAVQALTYL
jgi:hypothetical protein